MSLRHTFLDNVGDLLRAGAFAQYPYSGILASNIRCCSALLGIRHFALLPGCFVISSKLSYKADYPALVT